MARWIPILSGLLIAQAVLAVVVNTTGEEYEAFQADEPLLAFDSNSVDGLRIEDGENSVQLKKRDGKWLLPNSQDFPASQSGVEGLLDKLSALEKGWPVATTGGAKRRFKVEEGDFERKLTLSSNEQTLAALYVGTSPGFRKVHVRPADEDAVFSADFNAWEANAGRDDWIDKGVLRLDESEVKRIEMPDFVLQREGAELTVADLGEEEEIDAEETRTLLGKLTGLRIESLLGTEDKPEYGQDEPAIEIAVRRKGGDALTYRFSRPTEGSYYVLKRSDLDQYLKVAEYAVNPIKETDRKKLVRAKAEIDPGGEDVEEGHSEPPTEETE